jgi:hypothetical protein
VSFLPVQFYPVAPGGESRSTREEEQRGSSELGSLSFSFFSPPGDTASSLQPALRKNLVKLRINILRPEDASGKSDHTGNMNPDRAVTAATKHAVSPHDSLHLRQKFPVHLAPFPV